MKYKEIILKDLIKKYERRDANSSSFRQSISIKLEKNKYPKYFEHSLEFDEAIEELVNKGYIFTKKLPHDTVVGTIILNIDRVDEIKQMLDIEGVSAKREALLNTLSLYDDEIIVNLKNDILDRINAKKSIKQYLDSDFLDAIKAIHYLEHLDHDIYERNASNYLFNDSKRLGKLKKVISNIYDNENVFIEKGIIGIKPYLYIKGTGKIRINKQIIDLESLNTSLGIPIDNPDIIEFIDIFKVTTIENLTTFYDYNDDGLIIYLGGFSTRSQTGILNKLKNNTLNFYHFGDIDFGGYTILNNLMESLGIQINAVNMDIDTLKGNLGYAQSFDDERYIEKLNSLLSKPLLEPYYEVINYMIEHKVWLEQESLYNK